MASFSDALREAWRRMDRGAPQQVIVVAQDGSDGVCSEQEALRYGRIILLRPERLAPGHRPLP